MKVKTFAKEGIMIYLPHDNKTIQSEKYLKNKLMIMYDFQLSDILGRFEMIGNTTINLVGKI